MLTRFSLALGVANRRCLPACPRISSAQFGLRSLMPADNGSPLGCHTGLDVPGHVRAVGPPAPAGLRVPAPSRDDLLAELADVIITTVIAMSGITGVQWTRPAVTWNGA
jgi:hypothetical protein